jgi:hypothetical protein
MEIKEKQFSEIEKRWKELDKEKTKSYIEEEFFEKIKEW